MGVTHYIWDELSDNVLMEMDETGAVNAQYTQEPGLHGSVISQNRSGTESFYHVDGQGSTRQLTDASGTVTDEATYSAFGTEIAKSGTTVNPWGYKGAMGYCTNPGTDDLYVRARTLSPMLGRWLSPDPLGVYEHSNVYQYCKTAPLDRADPSGTLSERLVGDPILGTCGAYGFVTEWQLAADEQNGFIMQRVSNQTTARECDGGRPRGCPPPVELLNRALRLNQQGLLNSGPSCPSGVYWEVWFVRGGRVFGRLDRPASGTDIFASFGFRSPTHGTLFKSGEASFIAADRPGIEDIIDRFFSQGAAGGVPEAGILLSACDRTQISDVYVRWRGDARHRNYKNARKQWDCCGCCPPPSELQLNGEISGRWGRTRLPDGTEQISVTYNEFEVPIDSATEEERAVCRDCE